MESTVNGLQTPFRAATAPLEEYDDGLLSFSLLFDQRAQS